MHACMIANLTTTVTVASACARRGLASFHCIVIFSYSIGCNFKVTPSEELFIMFMAHPREITILYDMAKTLISPHSSSLTDAIIKTKETNKTVNNDLCTILSLEVYRGRGQAIAIEHNVFTLTDSGTLKVYIL